VNRHPLKLTQLMLFSRRAPIDRTPAEVGMDYESVAFRAGDGVGLKGWFIPSGAAEPGPAIVVIHGWMWNRLGNVAGKVPIDDRDVDFLPVTRTLHDAGFHVLLFDLRRHGESEAGRDLLTFGPIEARDFVGAVNYLRSRPDVDGQRIGALGISMGGSIALHGAPDCQPIKALLAYQPSTVPVFNANFCEDQFGAVGKPLPLGVELIYRLWRSPPPSSQYPGHPASRLNGTIVHYAQGTGDKWGTMADVESMHAGTPHTDGPIERFPSTSRYDGYRYVTERREQIAEFFTQNL
jgi:pimeloyl-ACP methyl ester carboxylesterase